MTREWTHSFGDFFTAQIFCRIVVIQVSSHPTLISSEGTLSASGEFPAFRLHTASTISA
ncbi:hypothetical protein DPMN_170065 [Dreissena polymorpha]|uniref:Uncharacterized protein n=1 Tax=Dreissena polymorpha TaxID=45954 RepID=A0A9D4DVQ8_DREPO|nr:hypothetical protein DPMN_170065 [Dreissena polymorpha]